MSRRDNVDPDRLVYSKEIRPTLSSLLLYKDRGQHEIKNAGEADARLRWGRNGHRCPSANGMTVDAYSGPLDE